jgi:hypothetical protein
MTNIYRYPDIFCPSNHQGKSAFQAYKSDKTFLNAYNRLGNRLL